MEALLDIPDLTEVNLDVEVTSWVDGSPVGTVSLAPEVFGVPVRRDVVHDVVRWQLAKRRSGNGQVSMPTCVLCVVCCELESVKFAYELALRSGGSLTRHPRDCYVVLISLRPEVQAFAVLRRSCGSVRAFAKGW